MRILIVIPQQDHASGNWVTARRFQRGLETLGHTTRLRDTPTEGPGLCERAISDFEPDVALLLHAYRTGKPWLETSGSVTIPSVVMLTGTDVNHGLDKSEQSGVIRATLEQARLIILQNPIIIAALAARFPDLVSKLRYVSPGILLGRQPYPLRIRHAIPQGLTLFLLPAGLRPVKGVLEILTPFDQLAAEGAPFLLAACGPVLDKDYGDRFLAAVQQRPWARYLGIVPPEAMAQAMRDADVVLNNSISEGLANSLLEAATLGIPILARNNPGNAAIVQHGLNGVLYDSAADCVELARELLRADRRRHLSRPDPRFDPAREAGELAIVLRTAVERSRKNAKL